jgi:hypothetical protein
MSFAVSSSDVPWPFALVKVGPARANDNLIEPAFRAGRQWMRSAQAQKSRAEPGFDVATAAAPYCFGASAGF